uniref:Tick transposon n=1 Tax=Rhipicephalus appendiculatus TaxID=34631 RepID=A0A131YK13_RHIAP
MALRVCLGLPRCSSTAETIAIANDYPAKTHIVMEALRAHVRHLARTPAHHLASLPEDRPGASFSQTVLSYRARLPTGYTAPARVPTPPWCMTHPQVRLTVPGIRSKARLSSPALKQLSLLLLYETYSEHNHLYTDASTTVDGSAGSVIIFATATTVKIKLSHQTTSTAAELAALRSALKVIHHQQAKKWSVFTDFKAALQCLIFALRRGPHEQLVLEIRELLHHVFIQGHDITFQWLPSHCGILGNEHADAAARSAHEDGKQEAIPFSRTDAAMKIRAIANEDVKSLWNAASLSHTRLHRLDPSRRLRPPSELSRLETTVLCRLWLGVSFTKSLAFRIGMEDSAACDHCGSDETIDHVLCHCPRYSAHRRPLAAVLARLDDRPLSEQSVLECRRELSSQRKSVKALLNFLHGSGLLNRL